MIYLNNAATSFPKPDSVIAAVNRYNASVPFHSDRSGVSKGQADVIHACRENLCRLFAVETPENIIFTSSATHSLNLILRGLIKDGDHVIATQAEHNSVLRLLKTLERQQTITLTLMECNKNGAVDPDAIKNCLQDNTKAVVVNHCSNVTGYVQDLKKIGHLLENHNAAFVVDGAQSAGSIDINVKDTLMDAFVFTGHKSLFGMQGTGGVYIRDTIAPEPLIIGGTGSKSDYLFQPEGRPFHYEAGTPNTPGIVSLNAGVCFILKEGRGAIQEKKAELKTSVLDLFLNTAAIKVYGGSDLKDFTHNEAVISFNINGLSPQDTGYILENSFGIICRSGLHCAPLIHSCLGSYPQGSVRISFSYFNEKKDIAVLTDAIHKIIKSL